MKYLPISYLGAILACFPNALFGGSPSGPDVGPVMRTTVENRLLTSSSVRDCLKKFDLQLTDDAYMYDAAGDTIFLLRWNIGKDRRIEMGIEQNPTLIRTRGKWKQADVLAARVTTVEELVRRKGKPPRLIVHTPAAKQEKIEVVPEVRPRSGP
jgi:hypothetical protein